MRASHIRLAGHHDCRCRYLDRTRFERGLRQVASVVTWLLAVTVLIAKLGSTTQLFGPLHAQRGSNAARRFEDQEPYPGYLTCASSRYQSQAANNATCDRLVLECPAPCTAILSPITPFDSQHE
jgi:hypothetical protein